MKIVNLKKKSDIKITTIKSQKYIIKTFKSRNLKPANNAYECVKLHCVYNIYVDLKQKNFCLLFQ